MQEFLKIVDFCNNRFHGRNACQNCRYGNYCQNCAHSNPDDCYCCNNEQVNMVVLNYMISDMIKFDKVGFPAFLERLKDFLGRQREAIVVFNDVFSIDVHNALSNIYHTFPYSTHFVVEGIRGRYFSKMNHGLVFGDQYPNNKLLFSSSPVESRLDPFRECKSIQLLIKTHKR